MDWPYSFDTHMNCTMTVERINQSASNADIQKHVWSGDFHMLDARSVLHMFNTERCRIGVHARSQWNVEQLLAWVVALPRDAITPVFVVPLSIALPRPYRAHLQLRATHSYHHNHSQHLTHPTTFSSIVKHPYHPQYYFPSLYFYQSISVDIHHHAELPSPIQRTETRFATIPFYIISPDS